MTPAGRVALVLGAGNVSSIPALDVLHKLFIEGQVVMLKMNPVNAYVGPILEEAMKPLVDQGYLSIVYGGADVGRELCEHDQVDEIHITGSDRTHDAIVWGEDRAERDRRRQNNEPRLGKRAADQELIHIGRDDLLAAAVRSSKDAAPRFDTFDHGLRLANIRA